MVLEIVILCFILGIVLLLWLYIEHVDNQQHEMYQEYARKIYSIDHKPKDK